MVCNWILKNVMLFTLLMKFFWQCITGMFWGINMNCSNLSFDSNIVLFSGLFYLNCLDEDEDC